MWWILGCALVVFGVAVTLGMVSGVRAADEERENALRERRRL